MTMSNGRSGLIGRLAVMARATLSVGLLVFAAMKISMGEISNDAMASFGYLGAAAAELVLAITLWLPAFRRISARVIMCAAGAGIIVAMLMQEPCGCAGGVIELSTGSRISVLGIAGLLASVDGIVASGVSDR